MNKPDWSNLPEWVKFIAQDYDGEWWMYEHEPVARGLSWSTGGRCDPVPLTAENLYWTDTLERRP